MPSSVLRMPIAGATLIRTGIKNSPGPWFRVWGIAEPWGCELFSAWGLAQGSGMFGASPLAGGLAR